MIKDHIDKLKHFQSFIPDGINIEDIDNLLISDNNILRPLRGLAFEYLINEIFIKKLKVKMFPGEGDGNIDKYFIINNNKVTLQIKTPVVKLTKKNKSFAVALHKTHGLEKKPKNLYPIKYPCPVCKHDGGKFPDFLIAKHPTNGIMIFPKNKIYENKKFPGHFADPFVVEWDNENLNKWENLGFKKYNNQNLLREKISEKNEFKKVSKIINLNDDEIIDLFLKPENFRLFRMNLLGNLREPGLKSFLDKKKIIHKNPIGSYPKHDLLINNFKVQIKGLSQHMCDSKNKIGTEIMGTHGFGAIRRYSKTDFDYICIVIDPRYLLNYKFIGNNYSFIFIKSEDLPLHYKNSSWGTKDKIYENIKLEIESDEKNIWVKPASNYKVPIEFGFNKIKLNKIPKEFI